MTFYFIGVPNEKGICMTKVMGYRDNSHMYYSVWCCSGPHHCPLVVTIIIPGSAPRRESNTVRGGGRGGEDTCTCILTSVIWHLEPAIGCGDT